jgi:hypothetical protein
LLLPQVTPDAGELGFPEGAAVVADVAAEAFGEREEPAAR